MGMTLEDAMKWAKDKHPTRHRTPVHACLAHQATAARVLADRIEQLEAVETAANTLLSRCGEQWSEDLIFSKRAAFQKLRKAALAAKEARDAKAD